MLRAFCPFIYNLHDKCYLKRLKHFALSIKQKIYEFLNKVLKGFWETKSAGPKRSKKKVVTKIRAVEPNIQQLSDDGLRLQKTAEFKENIKSATSKITAQIEQIKEQIKIQPTLMKRSSFLKN